MSKSFVVVRSVVPAVCPAAFLPIFTSAAAALLFHRGGRFVRFGGHGRYCHWRRRLGGH